MSISVHTINLTGIFMWEKMCEIENSCENLVRRNFVKIKSKLKCGYHEMLNSIHRSPGSFLIDECVFDIIDVNLETDLEGSSSYQVRFIYDNILENRDSFCCEGTIKRVVDVEPESKIGVYQLVYHGPGVTFFTETISLTPCLDWKEAHLKLTVRRFNWISNSEKKPGNIPTIMEDGL